MGNYKFVMLDIDDTLFDFQKAERSCLENTLAEFELYMSDELYNRYRKINMELWHKYEDGMTTAEDLRIARFMRLFEEFSIKNIKPEKFNLKFLHFLSNDTSLIDGAEDFCAYLKTQKYSTIIVSNGAKESQCRRVKGSSVSKYIDYIVVSEEAGFPKPHPAIFEFAMQKAGINDKKEAVIIGDLLTADIRGGNEFGIDTVWYNPKRNSNNSGIIPKFEVSNYEEIKEILK